MRKPKEPIRLRQKPLRGGGVSLYLDIYRDGRRAYEFLKLYLIPERTPIDKEQNRETLRTAQAIKTQRLLELQNTAYDLPNRAIRGRVALSDYAEANQPRNTAARWFIKVLRDYDNTAKISAINKSFVLGFIAHVDTLKKRNGEPLKPNTKQALYINLCAVLNRAARDGLLPHNPTHDLTPDERPHATQAQRGYLTADEVAELVAAPCRYPDTKSAFLFCCFCGLRFSDMIKLTWGDIRTLSDGSKQAEIRQKKTAEVLYLPLSQNALRWLPQRPDNAEPTARIFRQKNYINYLRQAQRWIRETTGRTVTWHTSRHTFATMLLTYGADIYTTSKLLGHTDVKTTQIYAKVVDANKRAATNLIPDFNPDNKPTK